MGFITESLLKLHGKGLTKSFDKAASQPHLAQRNLLGRILQHNTDTEFARRNYFHKIHSEASYRQYVAIQDDKSLQPYLTRMMAGEQKLLTHDTPVMFATTGGTDGELRYSPVTAESKDIMTELMGQFIYRAMIDYPGLLKYKTLPIVGSSVEGYTEGGIPYGDISGAVFNGLPLVFQQNCAVPHQVSEIRDDAQRYYMIARLSLAERISYIIAPDPSTLIRLAGVIESNQQSLIRAIYDGKPGIELTDSNSLFIPPLAPNREKADYLNRILEKKGKLIPADCWPDLKLISSQFNNSAGMIAAQIREYYDKPVRDMGLMTAEASMSLTHTNDTPSGILAIQSNYYEFVPEQDMNNPNPPVMGAHELEAGKRYYILLTTTSGLYRYNIDQIIEVTGFYHKTPLISFISMEKRYLT